MNKLLFLGTAALALLVTENAVAADFPLEPVAKASFVSRFTWTGCYLGAHVGGAWERKDATDPVLLVQDNAVFGVPGSTVGITTARVNSSGVIYGGQVGCDYQFAPNWVVGAEGAVSAGSLKGSTLVALPLGNPGDTAVVTARTDFIPSLTARLGYAVDHWLFYGKGGVAWTNDKYSITGGFQGTAYDAEGLGMRTGWTAGAGVEWAFTDNWSARLEYDYYDFGRANVLMSDAANVFSSIVTYRQSAQTVKLGLNFRVGQ
ncbi:MAG: outer membrane beta-barrel protein [Bradyrhizobium sp.]